MPTLVRYLTIGVALAAATGVAYADAQTPTISGNGWVALAIIAFFIGGIFLLIMGALHVERRDATLGRGGRDGDGDRHGWFGFTRDDDDAPDGGNGNN